MGMRMRQGVKAKPKPDPIKRPPAAPQTTTRTIAPSPDSLAQSQSPVAFPALEVAAISQKPQADLVPADQQSPKRQKAADADLRPDIDPDPVVVVPSLDPSTTVQRRWWDSVRLVPDVMDGLAARKLAQWWSARQDRRASTPPLFMLSGPSGCGKACAVRMLPGATVHDVSVTCLGELLDRLREQVPSARLDDRVGPADDSGRGGRAALWLVTGVDCVGTGDAPAEEESLPDRAGAGARLHKRQRKPEDIIAALLHFIRQRGPYMPSVVCTAVNVHDVECLRPLVKAMPRAEARPVDVRAMRRLLSHTTADPRDVDRAIRDVGPIGDARQAMMELRMLTMERQQRARVPPTPTPTCGGNTAAPVSHVRRDKMPTNPFDAARLLLATTSGAAAALDRGGSGTCAMDAVSALQDSFPLTAALVHANMFADVPVPRDSAARELQQCESAYRVADAFSTGAVMQAWGRHGVSEEAGTLAATVTLMAQRRAATGLCANSGTAMTLPVTSPPPLYLQRQACSRLLAACSSKCAYLFTKPPLAKRECLSNLWDMWTLLRPRDHDGQCEPSCRCVRATLKQSGALPAEAYFQGETSSAQLTSDPWLALSGVEESCLDAWDTAGLKRNPHNKQSKQNKQRGGRAKPPCASADPDADAARCGPRPSLILCTHVDDECVPGHE